jgi:hypothetical protein
MGPEGDDPQRFGGSRGFGFLGGGNRWEDRQHDRKRPKSEQLFHPTMLSRKAPKRKRKSPGEGHAMAVRSSRNEGDERPDSPDLKRPPMRLPVVDYGNSRKNQQY